SPLTDGGGGDESAGGEAARRPVQLNAGAIRIGAENQDGRVRIGEGENRSGVTEHRATAGFEGGGGAGDIIHHEGQVGEAKRVHRPQAAGNGRRRAEMNQFDHQIAVAHDLRGHHHVVRYAQQVVDGVFHGKHSLFHKTERLPVEAPGALEIGDTKADVGTACGELGHGGYLRERVGGGEAAAGGSGRRTVTG